MILYMVRFKYALFTRFHRTSFHLIQNEIVTTYHNHIIFILTCHKCVQCSSLLQKIDQSKKMLVNFKSRTLIVLFENLLVMSILCAAERDSVRCMPGYGGKRTGPEYMINIFEKKCQLHLPIAISIIFEAISVHRTLTLCHQVCYLLWQQ